MTQLLPSALSPTRSKRQAMWRGSLGKCPACGSGGLQWALRMHGFADTNTTFVEETESQ